MAYSLCTIRKQAAYDAAVDQILNKDTDGNVHGRGCGRGGCRCRRGTVIQTAQDLSKNIPLEVYSHGRGRSRPHSSNGVIA